MADAARAAGRGLSHTFEGQTWHLTPLGPDQLALFEVWLENQAFARVERLRGKVDEPTYAARLAQVTSLVCSGHFAVGGAAAVEAYQSAAGQRYSLYLMLLQQHPEVDEALAARMWEQDRDAILAKMNASEGIDPASDDPNAEAPEANSSAA